MGERFPGDAAAANGFGRRSLHEWEAHLLHEANYPAPPDMRSPGRWRLSAGGVPVPPLPDVEHPGYFHAEIERVRASLSEEERALPEYDAGNHEAWAAYFERRQAERLASINNAPVVRGRNNSDGHRLWWGAPGRTLHAVLEYLEGGNDPPLEYPAAPALRRSGGPWLPRRMLGGSSSSSRSFSHSSGSPALFSVKAEPVETPLGRRTRSAGIVINEGRASSSAPPHLVKTKTEPGLTAVKMEPGLDDEAAMKRARED
jgi:hypothetical protein